MADHDEWLHSPEWRAFMSQASPGVRDFARDACRFAVTAERRQLREQVEALIAETVDAHGHATIGAPHWLPRDAVLDLLGEAE